MQTSSLCKKKFYSIIWKAFGRQYGLRVGAHKESRNFKNFMEINWPKNFANIKGNILKKTTFDDESVQNKGTAEVLPFLLKAFNSQRPQLYAGSTDRKEMLSNSEAQPSEKPADKSSEAELFVCQENQILQELKKAEVNRKRQ